MALLQKGMPSTKLPRMWGSIFRGTQLFLLFPIPHGSFGANPDGDKWQRSILLKGFINLSHYNVRYMWQFTTVIKTIVGGQSRFLVWLNLNAQKTLKSGIPTGNAVDHLSFPV